MTKSPLDQQQFRAEGKANSAVVLNLGYTETNWEETLKKKKNQWVSPSWRPAETLQVSIRYSPNSMLGGGHYPTSESLIFKPGVFKLKTHIRITWRTYYTKIQNELLKNLCKKQVPNVAQAAVPSWYCGNPCPAAATGENLFILLQLQQNSRKGQRPTGKVILLLQVNYFNKL